MLFQSYKLEDSHIRRAYKGQFWFITWHEMVPALHCPLLIHLKVSLYWNNLSNTPIVGYARQTSKSRGYTSSVTETTTLPTLSSFLVEIVESTTLELSSSFDDSAGIEEGNMEPICTPISEAIKDKGIDDLTK